MELRLEPRAAAAELRGADARILADPPHQACVPRAAVAGAAHWAPWAWRALDARALADDARRAAAVILPKARARAPPGGAGSAAPRLRPRFTGSQSLPVSACAVCWALRGCAASARAAQGHVRRLRQAGDLDRRRRAVSQGMCSACAGPGSG